MVFKVNVELEKLEARLQYESSSAPPLALLSVEAVAVDLTVRPDTLTATASLGNLRAQDGVLPEVRRPTVQFQTTWVCWVCAVKRTPLMFASAQQACEGTSFCSWMSPLCATYSSVHCSVASRLA